MEHVRFVEQHDAYNELISALSPFNLGELLAMTGALQLMPENADRSTRLEILATALTSIDYREDAPNISLRRFRSVLNRGPLSNELFLRTEDPFNNPFVEVITFHGGPYRVFPGFDGTPTFVMQHLLNCLFLTPRPTINSEVLGKMYQLIGAVLFLSDVIAKRADLDQNAIPVPALNGEIILPDPLRRKRLTEAVSFSMLDLELILNEFGVSSDDLAPLIITCGEATLDYEMSNPISLVRRPLVRTGDDVVVPLPTVLLDSLRNELLNLVTNSEIVVEVVESYRDTVWHTATTALSRLGSDEVVPPFEIEQDANIREGFFQFDRDKIMHVCLVTDDLSSYDSENPFSRFKIVKQEIDEILSRHCRLQSKILSLPVGAPNEVMLLLLLQDVGRGLVAANPSPPADNLVIAMTAADLHTISMLNEDQLMLWKYAKALKRLKNSTTLVSWGQLDVFSAYRSQDYTFYFSDDALPNLLSFIPEGAGDLRRDVQQRLNIHAVMSYKDNRIREVVALHDARTIPEYVILRDLGKGVAVLLEGYPIPLWFVGQEGYSPDDVEYHKLRAEIADALAYWFWEISSSLIPQMDQIEASISCIVFRVILIPSISWFVKNNEKKGPQDEPSINNCVTVETDLCNSQITATLEAGLGQLLTYPDNRGERELLRLLLLALAEIIGNCTQNKISDSWIDDVIDQHAPLGRKKKFFFLDISSNPCLDPRGLPEIRKIHNEDRSEILDDIGRHFVEHIGFGPIPSENRKSVVDDTVTFAFQSLESSIASLDPEGVLETFIGLYESCVRGRHLDRLTIPTRIACFGAQSDSVQHVQEEIQENASASVVCRFIIEYLAAKPPNGYRPMSLSMIDTLQALAEIIVIMGTTSDLFQFGLAEVDLEILPSGRLAIDMEEYSKARGAFFPSHVADVVDASEANYERHWKQFSSELTYDLEHKLEEAFSAEFGFTLSNFISIISELIHLGDLASPTIPNISEEALVEMLTERLSWPRNRVVSAIDQLTLSPRTEFLQLSEPYSRKDVYPWRTNRGLSYIRKPLIRRKTLEGTEILFGPRHLYEAGRQLLQLCLDGRLDATSPKMKKLMGTCRAREGLEFNSIVADAFRQDARAIVRESVKKVKLNEGVLLPPGDIDVLVADTSTRRLIVIECKDMSAAFQPHDVNRELNSLFVDSASHKSTVTKHKVRIEWVTNHKSELLEWLGVRNAERWVVEGRIVMNRRSLTKYIRTSPVPILVLADILSRMQ